MAEWEIRRSRPFLSGCVEVLGLKSPAISCSLSHTLMVITESWTLWAALGGVGAGAEQPPLHRCSSNVHTETQRGSEYFTGNITLCAVHPTDTKPITVKSDFTVQAELWHQDCIFKRIGRFLESYSMALDPHFHWSNILEKHSNARRNSTGG